jgi:hypothetical protein
MKTRLTLMALLAGMFFLWGCYPGGPEYAEEMDVVLSYHNDDYNFASKATYAMPDKIVMLTGSVIEGDDPTFIPDGTAKLILDRIESNMTAMGWQRVDIADTANIDMLLLPASWEVTTVYYYYDYWGWWYGGYYPYWGYYPYYSYSSYSTGTLLMSLIDPKVLSGNGNPVVQWTAALNGILTSTYDVSRVNSGIDKAFDQSPYLKTN